MKRIAVAVSLWFVVMPAARADVGPVHWPGSGERRIEVAMNMHPRNWPVSWALAEWSESPSIELVRVTVPDPCSIEVQTDIQVCLYNAGRTTWLGLANVFRIDGHITWVYIDLNSAKAWTWRKKQIVLCHELGHGLGLEHRPETADDSCMVSRASYVVGAPQADAKDLEDLVTMYSHTDEPVEPEGGRAGSPTLRYVSSDPARNSLR